MLARESRVAFVSWSCHNIKRNDSYWNFCVISLFIELALLVLNEVNVWCVGYLHRNL